jgi:hypothetical protein
VSQNSQWLSHRGRSVPEGASDFATHRDSMFRCSDAASDDIAERIGRVRSPRQRLAKIPGMLELCKKVRRKRPLEHQRPASRTERLWGGGGTASMLACGHALLRCTHAASVRGRGPLRLDISGQEQTAHRVNLSQNGVRGGAGGVWAAGAVCAADAGRQSAPRRGGGRGRGAAAILASDVDLPRRRGREPGVSILEAAHLD